MELPLPPMEAAPGPIAAFWKVWSLNADDGWYGLHADVLGNADRAFVVYFTHPERKPGEQFGFDEIHPYYDKRTSLQVAELELENGMLTCHRNKEFDFHLIA